MRKDGQRLATGSGARRIASQQEVCARAIVVGQESVVANINLIQVDRTNQLVAAIADIADLKYGLESDLALNTNAVFVNARQLQFRIDQKSDISAQCQIVDAGESQRWRIERRCNHWWRRTDHRRQAKVDWRNRQSLVLQGIICRTHVLVIDIAFPEPTAQDCLALPWENAPQ